MHQKILVIDLFAGPGGLGEGFSACSTEDGKLAFKIGISVEKDPAAHKTLTTRALFRKLITNNQAHQDYYKYVMGKITREDLFRKYPEEARLAQEETLHSPQTLGEDNEIIHKRIKELVESHNGFKIVIADLHVKLIH